MNFSLPAIGIGFVISLLVLIAVFVFFLTDSALTRDWILGLIGALALARMLP